MNKEIKNWTFDDLKNHVIARLFDALIRGGTKEMSSEFYVIFSVICQWQEFQREKNPKS